MNYLLWVCPYRVAMERTRTRILHGASASEVASQPNYLDHPNAWAEFVEKMTQQSYCHEKPGRWGVAAYYPSAW